MGYPQYDLAYPQQSDYTGNRALGPAGPASRNLLACSLWRAGGCYSLLFLNPFRPSPEGATHPAAARTPAPLAGAAEPGLVGVEAAAAPMDEELETRSSLALRCVPDGLKVLTKGNKNTSRHNPAH